MRRVVLVGLVLLVCVGLAGCGGGGGTLPTAEVSAVFDRYSQAALTEDSELLASCYAASFVVVDTTGQSHQVTRAMCIDAWNITFGLIDYSQYEFTGMQITFTGPNADRAIVSASINVTGYSSWTNEWYTNTLVGQWELQKLDGQWLIVKEKQLA